MHLFERIGIEIEYMIVDDRTLSVQPIADRIIPPEGDRIFDPSLPSLDKGELGGWDAICWSNELAAHVIELKVSEPAVSLDGLPREFDRHVARVNAELAPHGARLMPSAMHPWMDPQTQTRLWPHDCGPVYRAYDRIFGCRGHGWANLQSTHVNLPFAGDEEFGRLHAAIRLILPILPALAASSPLIEGRATGCMDNRLAVYRTNSSRIPSIAGRVVPEPIYTQRAYRQEILAAMYRDIAPHDPEGVLRHEWLNARGATARLDRNTIEIRVLDVQECPAADVAIVRAILAVLRALVAERWSDVAAQQAWPVEPLESILLRTIQDGESALIDDSRYLKSFGYHARSACTGVELWRHLVESLDAAISLDDPAESACLEMILSRGTLARRLIRRLGEDCSATRLESAYRRLCECLAAGTPFKE